MKKRKKIKIFSRNFKKGFSILEAIISVFILIFGIVALLGFLSSSLINSMNNRNQIIATGLSQEGIELVRNVRDNNIASSAAQVFFNMPASDQTDCRIDYLSTIDCSASTKQLYYSAGGFYTHTAGETITKFQRRIEFSYSRVPPGNGDTATVVSKVIWEGGSFSSCTLKNKCIMTETVLTSR